MRTLLGQLGRLVALRADAGLVLLSLAGAAVATQIAVAVLLPERFHTPDGLLERRGDVVVDSGAPLEEGPAAGLSLQIGGDVDGLAPGSVSLLPVNIDNGSEVEVVIVRLDVAVEDSDMPGCPLGWLTVGTSGSPGGASIPTEAGLAPGGTARIEVPLVLAPDAPSACQGATFGLGFRAHGVLP